MPFFILINQFLTFSCSRGALTLTSRCRLWKVKHLRHFVICVKILAVLSLLRFNNNQVCFHRKILFSKEQKTQAAEAGPLTPRGFPDRGVLSRGDGLGDPMSGSRSPGASGHPGSL